jgi:hypothetical protein
MAFNATARLSMDVVSGEGMFPSNFYAVQGAYYHQNILQRSGDFIHWFQAMTREELSEFLHWAHQNYSIYDQVQNCLFK